MPLVDKGEIMNKGDKVRNPKYACYKCGKNLDEKDLKFILPYAEFGKGTVMCATCYEKYIISQQVPEANTSKAIRTRGAQQLLINDNILLK